MAGDPRRRLQSASGHMHIALPRDVHTCRCVNETIQEFRLTDSGKIDKTPTWRRLHTTLGKHSR